MVCKILCCMKSLFWVLLIHGNGNGPNPKMKVKKMTNELVVSAGFATFSRDGLRTVKITTLRGAPESTEFFVEMHDEPGVVRRVLNSVFNTDKPIKAWNDEDGADITIEGRGTITFNSHKFSGPKYPVARIINSKTGNPRNVRMTFLVGENEPTTVIEGEIINNHVPSVEIETVEAELVTENDTMTKPVKSDYANFGEYMRACKQFKAWEREQANKSTELAVV